MIKGKVLPKHPVFLTTCLYQIISVKNTVFTHTPASSEYLKTNLIESD